MRLTRAATARPPGIWTLSHGDVTSLGDETAPLPPFARHAPWSSRSVINRIKEGGWKWREIRVTRRSFHLSESTLTGFLRVSKWFFGGYRPDPGRAGGAQDEAARPPAEVRAQAFDRQAALRHDGSHRFGLAIAELEQDAPARGHQPRQLQRHA